MRAQLADPPSRAVATGPLTDGGRCHGVVGRLNAEFVRLRLSPGTAAVVAEWAATVPGLAECGELVHVERVLLAKASDPTWRGLLQRAQGGDELAARVLLQACLGCALALARRTAHHSAGDVEEAESVALARLWELLASYRLSRASTVRDGLSLEVLRTLTHTDARSARSRPSGTGADLQDLAAATPAPDLPDPLHPVGRPDEDVLRLLTWAVGRGDLSREDAALLWRVHSPADLNTARAEAAKDLRVSEATLRQRAARAKARLLAAVREATAG